MKVYVVEGGHYYEGAEIKVIFLKKEDAEKYVDALNELTKEALAEDAYIPTGGVAYKKYECENQNFYSSYDYVTITEHVVL